MARDLNRIMEAVRAQRDVYVTDEGFVEDAQEATENAAQEIARQGESRQRTQLKPAVFGA